LKFEGEGAKAIRALGVRKNLSREREGGGQEVEKGKVEGRYKKLCKKGDPLSRRHGGEKGAEPKKTQKNKRKRKERLI